jgi:predicted helicase
MMAAKARLLENILERAITSDEITQENTSLGEQYKTFKNILIHDLSPKAFADIYAQTLAYGMFAARLHDTTLDDFSRYEAAELIPKSNPFLRKLFGYIAGPDIDERIMRTVDNLADVFRATNVEQLLKNFGKSTQTHDPIIHFYETFLAEYDPKLRKARGVWYTPEPVVNFIVRAVDDILKTEFDLPQGLADTSKSNIKVPIQGSKKMQEIAVHKVQILDPATGTGTFLAEVVKLIYSKRFNAMQGAWSSYVDEHLIPRLNGFELLMASYSMAHLKLDMLLRDTGYKPTKTQRFNIYLTNSLEEHHPDTGTLFSNWLSSEANEANHIKRDTPVMCVIGNPPYSSSSSNKGEWIENLMNEYKKDLREQNINSLSDDYVKFIRLGQYLIEKNKTGVLAYISNNSFIDGLTHRRMRNSLLESFDSIYILDLHGNSKKKEQSPNGEKDQNVFDIMQGVSINIFVKKNTRNKQATLNHFDLFGTRNRKYDYLTKNSIGTINWKNLEISKPNYFFVYKDLKLASNYNNYISTNILFTNKGSGIKFRKDNLLVRYHETENSVNQMLTDINTLEESIIKKKYSLTDTKDWKLNEKKHLFIENDIVNIVPVNYRPFELRYTYYPKNSINQIIVRGDSRVGLMSNLLERENLAILLPRQAITERFGFFLSKLICDINYTGVAGQFGAGMVFPLYLYPEPTAQRTIEPFIPPLEGSGEIRYPNLNAEIIKQIEGKLGLTFTNEKETTENTFAPIDILDYIYAILHSPTYREKYKEFLKIDFPRVPYPKNKETFFKLVKLGGEIRQIHLLESPTVENFITEYPIDGDNVVVKPMYKNDKVFINKTQYFDRVPEVAWNFYIGGYQPAQKWLKDRKGRKLEFEDLLHYQKIIVALSETDRLMKEIDEIEIE